MNPKATRWARSVALVAAIFAVSSCSVLPRSGPNKREIYAGSVQREGDAFVVEVNERVTRATAVVPALGFSDSFLNAGLVGSDVIRPGDTLSLTIWENVDDGLLASEGVNFTRLNAVQVDGAGFIFVPYAGRIRAAGNTPDAIRRIITEKLQDQTPDPQVEVVREAGDGASVTLIGSVSGNGVYPIERPTRRLSSMIAAAGGITAVTPDSARITVVRGGQRQTIWYQDLFDDPRYDIALRDGDRIIVEEDNRSFTVLGATGTQAVIDFESQTLSGIEALAQAGGLKATAADPTGVFVFRNEAPEIANHVLGRTDLQGAQRMVYVLDLTKPNGMFNARDFLIRDGDLVYVTEAPFTQWDKTIGALTGSLSTVDTLQSVAQ